MASTNESAGESNAADVREPSVPHSAETRRSEVDLHLRTMALEAAANAILIADRGGSIVWTNPAFSVLTGYSRAELIGKSTTLLWSDAQSEAFYEEMIGAVLAGRVWKGVLMSRRKDGSVYNEEMTITPVLSGGEITHFISVAEDVTERRRLEEGVKQQAERLRLAIDGAALATWHWDIVTGRETWSDQWYALFGLPPGTVGTRETFLAMIHPDDREILKATRASALTGSPFDVEYRVLRRDGSEHWIASKGRAYFDAGGKPVRMEGVARDVTEYKRLEERLRQAQKMEAVGRLAGGIAHDFNNLMAVILGYTEILLARTDATQVQRTKLAHILKATERAASLTRQLLAFSRKQVLEPRILDLNAVVLDFAKMVGRLIGEDIVVAVDAAPDLGKVQADPGQIEQVIMNIAINARDAMPAGGHLTFETANVDVDEAAARSHPDARPGAYVRLTVRDTGGGMDAATLSHVFEPFFTTKGPDKGPVSAWPPSTGSSRRVVATSRWRASSGVEPPSGSTYRASSLPARPRRTSPGVGRRPRPPARPPSSWWTAMQAAHWSRDARGQRLPGPRCGER